MTDDSSITPGTAARDLRMLVDAGWLAARGQTRGRFYVGAPELVRLRRELVGERARLVDPYAAGEQLEIGGVVGSG